MSPNDTMIGSFTYPFIFENTLFTTARHKIIFSTPQIYKKYFAKVKILAKYFYQSVSLATIYSSTSSSLYKYRRKHHL